MKNKSLYIALGVLAVAGIGFWLYKRSQKSSTTTAETKPESTPTTRPASPSAATTKKTGIDAVKNVQSQMHVGACPCPKCKNCECSKERCKPID